MRRTGLQLALSCLHRNRFFLFFSPSVVPCSGTETTPLRDGNENLPTSFREKRVDAAGNETLLEWKVEAFEFWEEEMTVYCPTKITYPGGSEV
jgi:riboflavin biosynthesis pyrimidine reductase